MVEYFSQSLKTFVQKHVGENQTLLGHIWARFLCNSAALNNNSVFKNTSTFWRALYQFLENTFVDFFNEF